MSKFMHFTTHERSSLPVVGFAALMLILAGAAWAAAETLTGTVINMSADTQTRATDSFTIFIDRTTPESEYSALVGVAQRKGQKGMQDMLWELKPKGHIRIGTGLGYPLSVIRSTREGGRRVLRILTDRPLQYYEVVNLLRSQDYPFSYLEITLDDHGQGEGTYIPFAKVAFKPNGDFDVTNYTGLPFKLANVRLESEARK